MENNENKLIASALRSRKAFERLSQYLDHADTLTSFGHSAWKEIAAYYETDRGAESCDTGIIKGRLIKASPKQDYLIEEYFASLPVEVSVENVLKLYEDLYRDRLRQNLIQALNVNNEKEITKLIEKYQTFKIEEQQDEIFNGKTVQELNAHFTGKNLIPLFPTALSQRVGGGIPRQSQLCIFARPDVGKSVAAINFAVGVAEAGFKVLYLGNEDAPAKLVFRILTRFLRKTEEEIKKDPDKSYEEAVKRGYKNITFLPAHPGNYAFLRAAIERHTPDLVILDQIRNMHFSKDGMTINLEQGCIATRNLAKEFNLVMCVVTQAGDSARNKVRLEMEDIEWSNCLAKGSLILMYNGEVRTVESLRTGDLVMGMDSTKRTVLMTGTGRQKMYRISHKNGDSYTVNENHILTLKNTDNRKRYGVLPKQIVDIPLRNILKNKKQLQYLKGIHTGVEYSSVVKLPIHPYLLGLWLADGFSHTFSISSSDKKMIKITKQYCADRQHVRVVNKTNYIIGFGQQSNGKKNPWNTHLRNLNVLNNKHIPDSYFRNSRLIRLHLLAGIIDGDGTMRGGGTQAHTFTVYSGTERFAKQVKLLAQSLGFYAAWHKVSTKEFTVNISGNVSHIPTRLKRKKATNDSQIEWLCSEISIEELPEDTYYGITVDGDNRFILGDSYIITHNTGVAAQMDLMVGLGQNPDLKEKGIVVLSFPKNKLSAPIQPITATIDYSRNRLTVST